MTETIDRAPYANDGDAHKVMVPKGMLLSLATEDIQGAQYKPTIRTYLHPEDVEKRFPDVWLPQEFYKRKRPSRRLITDRCINPLDPEYKIPSGENRLPAGEMVFSNRITDLMDVSDIPGAKPTILYKGPVRVRIEDIVFDRKSHPAKRFFERLRCPVGTGLELWDINIGKKQFGFDRHPRTNPVEPIYPTEIPETDEQKFKRLKKKKIGVRKRFWYSSEPVIERVLDKLYWKPSQLASVCKDYDVDDTQRVSYEDLRASLASFGVTFTDEEFNRLIPHADQEGSGSVKYLKFSKALKLPSGLQKIVTKRLGQDQWEGIYSNMGQGWQVLTESHARGKKQMKEAEEKYHLVNVITGDPLLERGMPLIPPREILCLSYKEQLAQAANIKRNLLFKSFMPEPPRSTFKLPPIVKDSQPPASTEPAPPSAEALAAPEAGTPVAAPPPEVAPPKPVGSPRKSAAAVSVEALPPPEAVVAPDVPAAAPVAAPPAGPPPVDDSKETRLPTIARQSVDAVQAMYKAARGKKLGPPTFKTRIRQEQRSADVDSVHYLA